MTRIDTQWGFAPQINRREGRWSILSDESPSGQAQKVHVVYKQGRSREDLKTIYDFANSWKQKGIRQVVLDNRGRSQPAVSGSCQFSCYMFELYHRPPMHPSRSDSEASYEIRFCNGRIAKGLTWKFWTSSSHSHPKNAPPLLQLLLWAELRRVTT